MDGVTTFDDATEVSPSTDGFAWTVPDGWQQGRGAWGGLVVAALTRAVEQAQGDPARAIRSITVHMMAPARVGEHVITVRPVREGAAVTTWTVEATSSEGEPVARMVAITGVARTADASHLHEEWGTARMPDVPAPSEVPLVPVGPPLGPVFLGNLDVRPIVGLPFAGGSASTQGWVGLRAPVRPSAGLLLALVDAWWPAVLPVLTSMPRMSTVSFSAALLIDPASVSIGEPLYSEATVAAAREGYTSEHRRLFTVDGRLAVENLQLMAIGS